MTKPLFGTLVDLPHTEDRNNAPETKEVTDKQVEFFVEHELSKIDHVLNYLLNK